MSDREKNISGQSGEKSTLRRLAPPLAFMFALCLLVVFCYEAGYSGLPPTEKRYEAAKANLSGLLQDKKRGNQREPWEKLAEEFRAIYDGDPDWPNRPAALFRHALSLEELASRSCARQDARKAISAYESLALKHASSRLADDALLRAARMRAAWLKDDKGALNLLQRLRKQYPAGDMIADANALEKAIRASARGKAAPDALKTAASRQAPREDSPEPSARRAAFAGDLPLRYNAAKSRVEALKKHPVKACWRQPWEELRDEFLQISRAGKNRLAPAAGFQAARCQESLAICSRLSGDHKKAIEMYLAVTRDYSGHVLADDALLEAAKIQSGLSGGMARARQLLEKMIREYPGGDMTPQGRKLLAQLRKQDASSLLASSSRNATSSGRNTGSVPELQVLSWDSPSKNSVEIVLEMSSPAKFSSRLEKGRKGSPARLIVVLENSTVTNDVRKGVKVSGSLLQAVSVRQTGKGSALQFDFRDVRKFDTRSEDNRIIVSVAAGNSGLPGRSRQSSATASANPAVRNVSGQHLGNMASQLGLTVHRVFIDAGHGGKDPGTSHNKIMERAITLDVALTLGRLLQNNGLQVVYSRTKDKAIQLSERTRLANNARADLFVSVHVNANDNPAVQGFETYYLSLASTPQAARVAALENAGSDRHLGDMQKMLADVMLNARADESKRLASDIQRLSLFRLKKREYNVRNNGVKSAPFHVLLGAQMPAVLVELGYCTNVAEARNLANPRFRHALAEGIAEGILAYRDRLLRNSTAGNSLTGKKSGAM